MRKRKHTLLMKWYCVLLSVAHMVTSPCDACRDLQTRTRIWINPYPWVRVRVSWGWGTGSPGKPQGYPCQSLVMVYLSRQRSYLFGVGTIFWSKIPIHNLDCWNIFIY